MANPRPIDIGDPTDLELDRSNNLALPVASTEAPGADQIPDTSVQVAVTYPEWRIEELARKYGEYDGR